MTKCTMYDPATGSITGSADLSDETLEAYVNLGESVLLDVEASPSAHYVQLDPLGVVAYTEEERLALAALQPGWVWQMPERVAVDMRALDDAKAKAWNRIKVARDVAEHAPFTCAGRTYDADGKATGRITGATNGAMMAAMASAPFSIDFTLADNSVATLSGAEMMAVGAALIEKVGAVFDTGRALRLAIESASTNVELDAIHWPE